MSPGALPPDHPTASGRAAPRVARPRRRENLWLPFLVSIVSVVVVFGTVGYFVSRAEQWPRIKLQFFNWDAMVEAFPAVLRGFWINVEIWVICIISIGLWALVLTLFRILSGPWFAPLRVFAIVYVDLFRGIPALLLVFLLGFGVPALQFFPARSLFSTSIFWGVVAMTLSYAAYATEVYRSGIESVHEGQRAAAKSLGLTQFQAMRYAIFPQAFRNVLPALLNLTIALQKDVALLSALGVRDAVQEARSFSLLEFNYSSLVVAAALFLVTTIPLARLVDYLTARDRRRRLQGGTI